ncbi:MAG: hypothetical protein FWG06_02430, partial [Clostridiales bacterium]|nr:hypothetical protein [Clostridiales bacterium]
MNKKERSLSLKTKIMLATVIPVLASFTLVIVVIFVSLNNFADDTARAKFLQMSQKYTYNFEEKLNSALNYLSIISSELEMQVEIGNVNRETLQKTVFNVFREYDLIDGSSIYFEHDMYDGADAYYLGTEYGTAASGRICWYFYKDGIGFAYLKEAMENEIEFEMPHYT